LKIRDTGECIGAMVSGEMKYIRYAQQYPRGIPIHIG